MNYLALSIIYPAVQNILLGHKKIELRTWVPSNSLPIRDLVLVENHNYLNDGDTDIEGVALAMVDIASYKKISMDEYMKLDEKSTLNKPWKDGFYAWEITNVRYLSPFCCIAMRGIYSIHTDDTIITTVR
ncbi:ASCH domain-containing protein [Aeromonas veronii]|uniref:ASCH domain-containing protein n=1 Tax=Aeromonas veronii TaxID=654 RepID=UPI003D24CA55